MKKNFLFIFFFLSAIITINAQDLSSPNGKIIVKTSPKGILTVYYQNSKVLEIPQTGFNGCQPAQNFKFVKEISQDYQMLSGKKRHCTNQAKEFEAGLSKNTKLVLRIYNDGIAFRYEISGLKNQTLPQELTSYKIPEGITRWFQQWTEAYEGFFPTSTTAKLKPEPSFSGTFTDEEGFNNRWGYPCLLEAEKDVFALISEANIERLQSASCLYNDKEIFKVVPDKNDKIIKGSWHSPWRVVIIGKLSDIVESTLITDVSEPNKLQDTDWIKPGVVSWIYWAYNHGSNDYDIIKKYVDMAKTLNLPYVLIDAEWDEMKNGKTIEDAVKYSLSQNVKPIIWYNSSVGWIDGAPGPKFRLNKPQDREKEFSWCEKIGVAGVKIDFFSGDNVLNMEYCQDLLECAAKHHLTVNFHGATVPRGWQRTYPNLLSTEGVYGAEWYNNVPTFTEKAASHNATLPFTRNVIGPMDYTPCAFSDSQHPHITSNAHELALTVLYESGLQHLADKPESYLSQPQEVQDFFKNLPSAWDETKFLAGYPGESIVLARRKGDVWYIAGINGKNIEQTLEFNLDFLNKNLPTTLFSDGEQQFSWENKTLEKPLNKITCKPQGGFIMVVNKVY